MTATTWQAYYFTQDRETYPYQQGASKNLTWSGINPTVNGYNIYLARAGDPLSTATSMPVRVMGLSNSFNCTVSDYWGVVGPIFNVTNGDQNGDPRQGGVYALIEAPTGTVFTYPIHFTCWWAYPSLNDLTNTAKKTQIIKTEWSASVEWLNSSPSVTFQIPLTSPAQSYKVLLVHSNHTL
jgi:hypothetical protein